MLTLHFAMGLDGVIPRLPVGEAHSGESVVGPEDLLAKLETLLGLAGITHPAPLRVAAYSKRLERLAGSTPFYLASWQVDPWGVARTVLAWRDELVAAGWDGEPIAGGGARLDALAQLERDPEPALPSGLADRLRAVLQRLAEASGLHDVLRIELAEPRHTCVAPWSRLLAALEAAGVMLREPGPPNAPAHATCDLGRLQQAILADTVAPPDSVRGDGSLVLFHAPTPREAAHGLAAWLRGQPQGAWPMDRCVVRGHQGAVLDAALHTYGLPSLGAMSSSPWRPALQVLPLLLSQLWSPKDPRRMLELLSLEVSPLKRRLRTALIEALADAPGVGGPTWTAAWQAVAEQSDEPDVIEGQVERWLAFEANPPEHGAAAATVVEIAQRVSEWAHHRAHSTSNDIEAATLATAAAQAAQLAELMRGWSHERISQPDLDQLLDAVTRSGSTRVLSRALSGSDRVVDEPAALLDPVDTVVWWGFVHSAAGNPSLTPWRLKERRACREAGLELPDPVAVQHARTRAWLQPILAARKRLVLVAFDTCDGEVESLHPVWDDIEGRLQIDGPQRALLQHAWSAALHEDAGATLPAGFATLPATSFELDWPAAAGGTWEVGPDAVAAREQESASSLEKLLGCPLQWTLTYGARLAASGLPRLTPDNRLFGNLGHRLIEELLLETAPKVPDPDVAKTRLNELFDTLVTGEASILMLPGWRETRDELRYRIARAGGTLVGAIATGGYSVEGCEVQINAVPFADTKLVGAADVLLRHPKHGRVVVDMKWGGSTYRMDALKNGTALQLALYAHALNERRAEKLPPTAYFILRDAQFVTTYPDLFAGAVVVDGPALEQTLHNATQTYRETRKDLAGGQIAVPPLLSDGDAMASRRADYPLTLEPSCGFCDFGALCGVSEEA